MNNFKIAIATKKDKKGLLTWFKHYKINKLIKRRVNCFLEHNFTIIAKKGDKIIGLLQWHIKEKPNDGLAEIEEVFVSKKYRKQGIASLLLIFTIKTIREFFIKLKIKPRKIFLFVGKANIPARKFYEKYGFKLIGNAGNLFHDKKEELFYTLDM